MARRKIIFVIVEGPSDDEALGVILSRIYGNDTVYVHIMHCDITSRSDVNPSNAAAKVAAEVAGYAKANHFDKAKKLFFREIIHIVDTDGTYIPDENVIFDRSVGHKPVYSETCIRTRNKQGIENRNMNKSANLDKLASCDTVWGLPYRVFYMSCNLDHVLYGKLNSSNREKEANSFNFAKRYRDRIPEFLNFICHSDFSVMSGYDESWEYIRRGLHSLERHTNLGLCFRRDDEP